MPHPGLSAALDRVRRAVAPEPPTDGRLLGEFVRSRDEAAFAELVRRHGPAVWAVCRRLVPDRHLAEDAFQAVFLTLARKADRLAGWESVGGWLREVARRVGRNARRAAARRRAHEVPLASGGREPPDPIVHQGAHAPRSPETEELGAVVLEELARLPDRFRTLLVMHYLDGRPQTEVATRLGLPAGTVNRRMMEARRALGDRLRARGVAPALGGLAGLVGVPAGLSARAVAAGMIPEYAPAAVAALSNGVTRTMLVQKLKLAAAGGLLVATVAGGLLAADPPKPALAPAEAPEPAARSAAAAKPRPKGPNKILIYKSGHLVLIDPDGKNEKRLTKEVGYARLSPDGTAYAGMVQIDKPADRLAGERPKHSLYVRKLGEPEPGKDLGVDCYTFCWSPDGTRLAVSVFVTGPGGQRACDHFLIDAKTGEKTALKLPGTHTIGAWTVDDKLVTDCTDATAGNPRPGLYLMNLDGTEHRRVTDGTVHTLYGRPSPDGKRLLALRYDRPVRETEAEKRDREAAGQPPFRVAAGLVVIDVATGEATPVQGAPEDPVASVFYGWSPDGKKIAYVGWEKHPGGAPEEGKRQEIESRLIVCDPDGKNAKTILTAKGVLGTPDWR